MPRKPNKRLNGSPPTFTIEALRDFFPVSGNFACRRGLAHDHARAPDLPGKDTVIVRHAFQRSGDFLAQLQRRLHLFVG